MVKAQMSRQITRAKCVVAVIASIMAFAGCVTIGLGPAFAEEEAIPADMVLIYLYRSYAYPGSADVNFVVTGDGPVTSMVAGGYYPHLATPGTIEFWLTDSPSRLSLVADAGQRYFVKIEINLIRLSYALKDVPEEQALREIAGCRLMQ